MLDALFSSKIRVKLLSAFFLSPGINHHALELAQSLQENYSTIWKELNRLERSGILISETVGNSKMYRVNPSCPIAPELRSIILKTRGIGTIIQSKLIEMGKVKEAFIFGSFASGEADEFSDLDLMIIGEVKLEQISPLIAEAEKELGRQINYLVFSEKEWEEKLTKHEPFALNVMQGSKIMLVGGNNEL